MLRQSQTSLDGIAVKLRELQLVIWEDILTDELLYPEISTHDGLGLRKVSINVPILCLPLQYAVNMGMYQSYVSPSSMQ